MHFKNILHRDIKAENLLLSNVIPLSRMLSNYAILDGPLNTTNGREIHFVEH